MDVTYTLRLGMARVDVHGYNTANAEPSVLFVCGWAGGEEDVAAQVTALARAGRHCIVATIAPLPRHERPRDALATIMQRLESAMSLRPGAYDVVGHSRGGLAVHEAIERKLIQPARALYLAPALSVSGPVRLVAPVREPLAWLLSSVPAVARTTGAALSHVLTCGCSDQGHARAFRERWKDRMLAAAHQRDLAFALESDERLVLGPDDIAIFGEGDPLVRRTSVVTRDGSGPQVHVLPSARHFPQVVRPDVVNHLFWPTQFPAPAAG